MAYTKAADGIAQRGKTHVDVMATDGPKVSPKTVKSGKGSKGGKTDADMKSMGRNLAKVANQKRG